LNLWGKSLQCRASVQNVAVACCSWWRQEKQHQRTNHKKEGAEGGRERLVGGCLTRGFVCLFNKENKQTNRLQEGGSDKTFCERVAC